MKLILAHVAQRSRSDLLATAAGEYLKRIEPYAAIEARHFRTPEAFFEFAGRQRARTPLGVALLDQRGKQLNSEEFAGWLSALRDSGRQAMLFAVGPADGWPQKARQEAETLLSLGPMTLPHELARLVLLEQIYRAFTILAGHPYHTGH
jgi:23S rRNA (pseudouridine1915-N3)-methyltransferase